MILLSEQFQEYLNDKFELSQIEREELVWRRFAYLSFAFVVLVVGLPIWWFTTTPYRAALPYIDSEYMHVLEEKLTQFSVSSNGNQRDVWSDLQPHTDYSIHFIFIHDKASKEEIDFSTKIERKIGLFVERYLNPIGIRAFLSIEHLWDFSLVDFLYNQKGSSSGPLLIDSSDPQLPASLCSELDQLVGSAPVGRVPLLKLAIFLPNFEGESIKLLHNGKSTTGLAVASWGGLFIAKLEEETALLNAIVAVLQMQFSIRAPPLSGELTCTKNCLNATLLFHKKRLVVENLLQTFRILNSIHELSASIVDLVIPDEVAKLAAEANTLFLKAFKDLQERDNFDSESAAESRRLVERANSDPSLLELLNFPAEQKYGIYVPLFLPLFVPMLQPLALFALFLLIRFKKWRKTTNIVEEKAELEERNKNE